MAGGSYGTTSQELTPNEVMTIENEMYVRYLEELTFSNLFARRPIPEGTMIRRLNMLKEMGAAHFVAEGAQFPVSEITREYEDLYIQKLGLEVQMTWEELWAIRDSGVPIDQMAFIEQTRQVAKLEEKNLVNLIRGIATSNGRVFNVSAISDSGAPWSSTGSTPYQDICVMTEKFRTAKTDVNLVLYGPKIEPYLRRKDPIDGVPLGEDIVRRYNLDLVYAEGLNDGELLFCNFNDIAIEEASPFRVDGPINVPESQYYRWIAWVRSIPYVKNYRSIAFLKAFD